MSTDIQKLDVAIIGAGASGCYTAWRLMADSKEYSGKKVTVFDYIKINNKPHVGGRLWSQTMPGVKNVRKAELGGMRYLTSQTLVYNIIPHLGFNSVPFDVDSHYNLFNLRSKVLRSGEVQDPSKVPFNLAPLEQGMSPGGLLLYAIETIVPNAPYLSTEEWLEVKKSFKVNGRYLRDWGFWNLLETVLSEESYQYVTSGQGYDTITSNWNAADAMEWVFSDFSADASYRYLQQGFEQLPMKLLEDAIQAGVGYEKHMKLLKWQKDGEEFLLTFQDTKQDSTVKVRAKKLVLAVPRKSLELIDMPNDKDTGVFYECLPSVQPQPMFKFFLGYHYPWWRTMGMTSGRTITDNPLRQIYYWGSNYQNFFQKSQKALKQDESTFTGGRLNKPDNSLMMIYTDGRDVTFWQPLFEIITKAADKIKELRVAENEISSHDGEFLKLNVAHADALLGEAELELQEELKQLMAANGVENAFAEELKQFNLAQMVASDKASDLNAEEEVQRRKFEILKDPTESLISSITNLLMRAHGMAFVPTPYAVAFADWTSDPFGGAYNLWKPGYKSWEVTDKMIRPFGDSTHAYVVGEAYSTKQGWVEGAFETAEKMLQTYLGITPPSWLEGDADYKI